MLENDSLAFKRKCIKPELSTPLEILIKEVTYGNYLWSLRLHLDVILKSINLREFLGTILTE